MDRNEARPAVDDGKQPPPEDGLGPGSVVGGYLLGDLIARGGCGAVHHATHATRGRRVALKILHADLATNRKVVERFFREIELLSLLRHPHIVEVYEWGALPDGRPFYAMEYLPGGTVNDLLRESGRLRPEEAYEVLEPVCAALKEAHAAGIVHRDIKGSNIAFTSAPRTAKLLDFGIAKLLSPDPGAAGLTTVGHRLGTPTSMAPEQLLGGPIDARTDVYALGLLLYRMLTGHPVFEERSLAALSRRHLEEPAPRPSRVARISPALDAVVLRCLEKRPELRFDSAKDVLAALGDAVGRGAADDTRPEPAPGVAIYVDIRLEAPDDLDEALLGDLSMVLDMAESTLAREQYVLVQTTGTGVLAVRLLPRGPGERSLAQGSAVALALTLHDEIARRPGADRRLHANVVVHAGEVLVRRASSPEIVGGALVNTRAWAPRGEAMSVCATRQAIAGLSDTDLEWLPGSGLVLTDAETMAE